jgi:hypothetical protein
VVGTVTEKRRRQPTKTLSSILLKVNSTIRFVQNFIPRLDFDEP